MTRKQLIVLFICNLLPFTVGTTLVTLLPLYAGELGADPSLTGLYMAVSFAVLAASTFSSGWLSSRFQTRKRFIMLAAALSVPTVLFVGQAQNVLLLTLFTSALWFLFGICTTMVNILTGMYADQKQRGRTFGIIGSAIACGQVLSGLTAGPIVDRWGFAALFAAAAGLYVVLILAALLLEDTKAGRVERVGRAAAPASLPFVLVLLLGAHVLAFTAHYVALMARPLAMDALNFSSSDITGTMAISGLINLPMPFILGWFGDRVGRRTALIVSYALPVAGIALLIPASLVWHFWIAQILIAMVNSSQSVGSALMTDLVEPEALSAGLSRYAAMPWVGAVIGYTLTGFVAQYAGLPVTLAAGVGLALASVPLVYATRLKRQQLATA